MSDTSSKGRADRPSSQGTTATERAATAPQRPTEAMEAMEAAEAARRPQEGAESTPSTKTVLVTVSGEYTSPSGAFYRLRAGEQLVLAIDDADALLKANSAVDPTSVEDEPEDEAEA